MKYAINDKHKHLKNSNKNKILVFVAFFQKNRTERMGQIT